ncbi:MAG: GDP-mannose 4,6-dehydratase [Phycisphaerae bacterium]
MKALITGGAGFIGSHLAERLLDRGDSVVAVDDLSTGRRENLSAAQGNPSFRFVRADVRDRSILTPLVDGCDVVFHLAAAVGVQLIVDQPVHTLETNIHGSEVVLSLASQFGRKVILASTSEVYGKNTKVPFAEDDDTLLGSTIYTRWSYAASKMVDEFLALAYHDQYHLPVIICRFFNTVGPRQSGAYGMVVPRFVQAALAGDPLTIYGSGLQSRCFCHVADIVEALVKLVDCHEATGKVINVGTSESVTIAELAERVIELTDSDSPVRNISYQQAYGRPFDDMLVRQPDLTRIKSLIDYQPTYNLTQTLQTVIDYEKGRMHP